MTLTAPPRPPRPPRPERSREPLEREEIEALVEALIEEARARARRRRQRYLEAALLSLLVGLALYAAFGGGGGAATGAPASHSAQQAVVGSLQTFRLFSVQTSARFSVKLYIRHELRNGVRGQFGRPKNAVVGSDAWVVTPLPPVEKRVGEHVYTSTLGAARVRATVRLPGGTLRLHGRSPASTYTRPGGNFTVRVVGGTGRYAKARGTCWVRWRPTLADWNDYRLRLP